ncbi:MULTISPECIES: hypothetical protein [Pelosinus]|uniref:Phage major tail protein, phi13 family n=1 Tax=Pelosinus fermentans B4 TaxID=1149862 RepID=I9B6D6_9FIRM|nr:MULTISPECIES: hypothetical protein [Pelosinus]EIW20712.1 hypothetical protein FB4_1924 [Pelosinus fermentans B4]EIW25443.1 hypothetical protein FA11_2602 [Pelosinus fermentans A11]OAM93703.1 hypothetical protein FR7_01720 [Pelosinus fermentans DSM 17108]SDQ87137.1 hypothetical protein SAMN04515679_1806 [Pelosinus fermentans]
MALAKSSGVFGVKNLKIFKMLTDAEGALPTWETTGISIPGIKSLKMSKKTKEVESRGDERLRDKETTFDSLDVSWENEEIPMDALVMIGGEAAIVHTAAGTGPVTPELNQVIESSDSVGSYFMIQCDTKRGSTAKGVKNVGVEIFKVQGSLSYDFVGEGFATCSFKGTAFACDGTIGGVAHPYRRLTFADGAITYA